MMVVDKDRVSSLLPPPQDHAWLCQRHHMSRSNAKSSRKVKSKKSKVMRGKAMETCSYTGRICVVYRMTGRQSRMTTIANYCD
jgi:hypothetical protein